jgi:hypothetical protein
MASQSPGARTVGGRWELLEVIGSGSFAIVWRARCTSSGQLGACKEVLTDKLNSKLLSSLESEIAVLQVRAKPPLEQRKTVQLLGCAAARGFLVAAVVVAAARSALPAPSAQRLRARQPGGLQSRTLG